DLSLEDGLVVLMDMIDGTDLLERRLSNWCSGMVFFEPRAKRIRASFVGMPDDGVYFATDDSEHAFKQPFGRESERKRARHLKRVTGPSQVKSADQASIAFYGQKLRNLVSTIDSPGFRRLLEGLSKSAGRAGARFYNLAGNPMMIKMID